jgi:cobyrinic acid a,c-diamide synthase
MTKPAVVLIGADKGGVGKTMVARTLLDSIEHQPARRQQPEKIHATQRDSGN